MQNLIQIDPAGMTGKQYWRSLNELANRPEFRQWVEREFPEGATEMLSPGSRRSMLKLMAASLSLAGLSACRRPEEKILPQAKGTERFVHGKPMHYATAASVGGLATGLIVEVNDGRPTKVEGNPKHPASLGATNAHMQALVLNLYDPERSAGVKRKGQRSTWDEFSAWLKQESAGWGDGSGLRILSERSSSPSLARVKAELMKRYPAAQWVEYDSVLFENARLGLELATGQALEPHYRFDQADVVFALDYDFLGLDSPSILPVKQFSAKRRVTKLDDNMSRLYAAEPNFTMTGAMADHRVRLRGSDAGELLTLLAKELNVSGAELKVLGGGLNDKTKKFIAVLAKDLLSHRGRSIVAAGPRQPAAVHALVAAINAALGNNGTTVVYTQAAVPGGSTLASVQKLQSDLSSGSVKALFVLGGNPAFTMPGDLKFGEAMKRAGTVVALTYDTNETARAAEWHLAEAHPFECWGDARSADGTVSIQQPLIEPLWLGKSALELAGMLAGLNKKGYDLVRDTWLPQWGAAAERKWQKSLFDGVVEGTSFPAVTVNVDTKAVMAKAVSAMAAPASGLEVCFYPSSGSYDGRFLNNAWMNEAPDPMTKLVWDNAALLSPATAKSLGVANGDLLAIAKDGREIRVPAMVLPGHADNSISLPLGYGRTEVGRVGRGVGHSVEPLRSTNAFYIAGGVQVRKAGGTYKLVTTQEHHTMVEPITGKARPIVREATLEHYREHPDVIGHMVHEPKMISLFGAFDYSKGQQWGMAIDLNACIGCNACLVACQSENNIPVVGKDQVDRGREMHWVRLDRYFTGNEEDPQAVMQPMACVQCENAPCESVCPVAATVHSPEGLNDMAYNRCVGTRYCANNCPYKVRRFNFLNWNKDLAESHKMVFNPDVTVRMRGVMEKCNYCVQRIQEKKIEAKAEGRRELRDGEVLTACQQVCPAEAITFGNINDPESRVAQLKKQPRDYTLLGELQTVPRTTYLAKLRNPNPELEETHG